MDPEKKEYTCYCPTCSSDPEAAAMETEGETEDETMSEDETPTTSDEEFIVSDSEMAEAEEEECEEDEIELLFESFVNLQEEHKIFKKELAKQSCLLWEIHQELKESKAKRSEAELS